MTTRKPTARMDALLLRLVDHKPDKHEPHRVLWQLFELAGASTVHGLRVRKLIRGGPGCHSPALEVTPSGIARAEAIRPKPWRTYYFEESPGVRKLGLYNGTDGLVAVFEDRLDIAERIAADLTRADLERACSFDLEIRK
jgi:hypothetical protein